MFGGDAAESVHTLGVLGSVHFRGDHDHRLLREFVAEAGEFLHDDFEIMHRVAAGGLGDVDQVREQPRALDVAQELDAESRARCAPSIRPGMSATTKVRKSIELHDAEVWFERGERIVGDLGTGGGNARDQGRFAGVGEADQADVGEQFQLKAKTALLAGAAGLMLGRAWWVEVAKRALPRPPRPPRAATKCWSGSVKSKTFSPVASS